MLVVDDVLASKILWLLMLGLVVDFLAEHEFWQTSREQGIHSLLPEGKAWEEANLLVLH